MSKRKKAVIEGRPCENCGKPLMTGRHITARLCLRKPCRTQVSKRYALKSTEKLKRLWNGSGY